MQIGNGIPSTATLYFILNESKPVVFVEELREKFLTV